MKICSITRQGLCVPRKRKSLPGKRSKKSSTTKKSNDNQVKGQSTRRKIDPAFYSIDPRKNPVVQHIYSDRIGDAKRASNILQGVTIATAYPLAPVRAAGPHGWALAFLITLGISIPIISYAQTADQYRDLVQFAETKEIYGHQVIGETHN